MTSVEPYLIATLCARHFGVSLRDLSLGHQDWRSWIASEGPWACADEARAIAIHLIRRHTALTHGQIGEMFDRPCAGWPSAMIGNLNSQIATRLKTDDWLLFTVRDIEAEIEAVFADEEIHRGRAA